MKLALFFGIIMYAILAAILGTCLWQLYDVPPVEAFSFTFGAFTILGVMEYFISRWYQNHQLTQMKDDLYENWSHDHFENENFDLDPHRKVERFLDPHAPSEETKDLGTNDHCHAPENCCGDPDCGNRGT